MSEIDIMVILTIIVVLAIIVIPAMYLVIFTVFATEIRLQLVCLTKIVVTGG